MTDVSLIMTLLNEERGLPTFLDSVGAQTVGPSEIVVVDGGSTDRTVDILNSWASQNSVDIRVVVSPGANISEGRNQAIQLATYETIAVTDAGTILEPAWLEELIKQLSPGIDVVAGFFGPFGTTWTEEVLATVTMPLVSEIDPASFLPSSRSLLLRRSAWASAGGYPEWLDYCEDLVFDIAMKDQGARFAFAPDAIARWSARSSFRSYAKQYYRYARGDGKANLWRKRHAARYGAYSLALIAIVARPSFVTGGLLSIGFLGYSRKFFTRVMARPTPHTCSRARTLAAVPIVVVVGDVAKMAGYPAGVLWRLRSKPTTTETDTIVHPSLDQPR